MSSAVCSSLKNDTVGPRAVGVPASQCPQLSPAAHMDGCKSSVRDVKNLIRNGY
jgi:hypothetical protein